jgi:hypothetical protein
MGLSKFRLSPAVSRKAVGRAYVTGLDRTATRLRTSIDGDILVCQREANESGRLFVPWPIEGYGSAYIGTATLAERAQPYDLAVELARGKLNDVRNQLADWRQMGLRTNDVLEEKLAQAQAAFYIAVTSREAPETSFAAAQACISASWATGQQLVELYVQQVIQTRVAGGVKLPTQLAVAIDSEPKRPWSDELKSAFNAVRLSASWRSINPTEGQNRWDVLDAQLAYATKNKFAVQAGPLIDLRPGALPDWLYLWEGDFESIVGLAVDLVRQAVTRYRGKIPVWTLIHRPASTEILGLNEEDQIRLTAKLLQSARHIDPSAQFLVGFDRPWGEWLGQNSFQLGPLHLADYLARSDMGLSGLALEIAPGYTSLGSGLRDLFDFSRLLDLYALINLPLSINLALPTSFAPDPLADSGVIVEPEDWASGLDESFQAHWAAGYIALAVAKPFVRSVTWNELSDSLPHLYPNAGLFRADQTPKPILSWMKTFRRDLLA